MSADPLINNLLLDSFNPEVMQETLQQSNFDHTILHKGHFDVRLLQAQVSDIRVDRGFYGLPMRALGQLTDDYISLGFMFSSVGPSLCNGLPAVSGDMMLYSEHQEFHGSLAAECDWVSLQFSRVCFESLGLELPRDIVAIPKLEKQVSTQLKHTLQPALDLIKVENTPRVVTQAAIVIQDAMLSAFCHRVSHLQIEIWKPENKILDTVRRAEDYIDANLSKAISIVDICNATGVPIYTLERAFTKIYGIGPKRFLGCRRLSVLRGLLLRSFSEEISVTHAAFSCGLTHLGRASINYKKLFGESPSETLAANKEG